VTKLQEVFASNLKAARKQAGLTQETQADKLGMSPKYQGTLERGLKFPSVAVIEQLAGALGVAAYELFMEPSAVPGTSPPRSLTLTTGSWRARSEKLGRSS